MPAIKLKKAAAEHQAEKEREEREREAEAPSTVVPKPVKEVKEVKETKEPKEGKDASATNSLLRGLDANILFEKRKRQTVPSEQKLLDWIEANLEVKENSHVNLNNLYDYFGEACSFDGTPVVDFEIFTKRISDKFGKFIALKESSPYKGIIKERIGKAKVTKVKADSLKIKMKDIIEEALKESGNPAKGIRFHSLKQYIACNYPAQRIDLRPGLLKVALNRGISLGQIQLVKGIGMAGFYRLPVDEEPDEEQEKSVEEEPDDTEEKTDPEHQNGDSAEGGEKAEDKKKAKKKKEGEKEEEAKDDKEGEAKEEEAEGEDKKKKKKKKSPKKKRPRLDSFGPVPQRIEDTFPMAMTYMAEPKQASFLKIRKFIFEYFPQIDENQLKKSLVRGTNKGLWEPLSEKNPFNGKYSLLIDEFDPNSNDNVEDMICSAIISCSEPKQASSTLLKRYVLEYHPEFNVESRPHLFKLALERAVKKHIIVQLSGIGATGTFQLIESYRPSPALLAGEEDEVEEIENDVSGDRYVPRGTKSRKLVPKDMNAEPRPPPTKRKPPRNRDEKSSRSRSKSSSKSAKSSSRSKGRPNYAQEDSEEEEDDILIEEIDEEEMEPKPKKARKQVKTSKSSKTPKSPVKNAKKPLSRSQVREEEEDEMKGREDKSKKSKKSIAVEEDEEEEMPQGKSSRGRSKPRPNYSDERGDSDDDELPKSKGRKSSGSKRSSKVSNEEDDDEDEEKSEYTPRKSKSRGGDTETESSPSPKKSKKRR